MILLSFLLLTQCFMLRSTCQKCVNMKSQNPRLWSNSRLSMVQQAKPQSTEITKLNDVINPSKFDLKRITFTVGGQFLLLNAALLLGQLLQIDVLHLDTLQAEAEILKETVFPAVAIFIVVFATSFVFRDVKLTEIQQFFRERKFYVLKTLGLQRNISQAALIALIISLGESISDEVFFRGFCYSSIHNQLDSIFGNSFGDGLAIFLGALVSGLAHVPIFGSNFFIESFLSCIYGLSFLTSNFNLVVPVTIHAIYSLVSMYVTWNFSTLEISKRIQAAQKKTDDLNSVPDQFEALARAIFEIIDLDESGKIDGKEMKLGLRLFG